ncbi:MAG: hypothetical protein CMP10_08795 [Zetaproteobacteria bacterium]|nr:hypothetical protein [Pseudobdellovibrionaceae bacterium]
MEDLARVFHTKVTRKGIRVDQEKADLLGRWFDDKGIGWSLKISALVALPGFRKQGKVLRNIWSQLNDIEFPKELRKMKECSGIFAVPTNGCWNVFSVVGGIPEREQDIEGDLDLGLQVNDLVSHLHKKIKQRVKKVGDKPMTCLEASLANRISWWITFGLRRHEGRFISLEDLESKRLSFF